MEVEIVTDPARLTSIVPSWQELATAASWANIFFEPWFITPALSLDTQACEHMFMWSDSTRLKLVGYLPLSPRVPGGFFRPKRLENWTHPYSFFGEPLIAKGHEGMFWHHLLNHIDKSPRLGTVIRFKTLRGDGASYDALKAELNKNSRLHLFYNITSRAFLNHGGSSQDYFKNNLPSKRLKEYRRQRRRLSELGELREEYFQPDKDVGKWVQQFLELENTGWKGREATAMLASPLSTKFFKTAAHNAAQLGKLFMYRMTLNDTPIAMMVNFNASPEGSFSFKIGFDETYAKYSPGVLMEISYIQRAMDTGELAPCWTDSCASEDHPMINKVWRDRLPLVSVKIAPKRLTSRIAFSYENKLTQLAHSTRKALKA